MESADFPLRGYETKHYEDAHVGGSTFPERFALQNKKANFDDFGLYLIRGGGIFTMIGASLTLEPCRR